MHSNFQHFWELLISITEKELKARYKNTFFGFLWIAINPLLQMLVIGFIFHFLVKEPVDNYFSYLFSGLLIWNFFSLSLTKAAPCILYERDLVKKARFPTSVIPLSIVFSNFIHFLFTLFIFFILVYFIGTININHIPLLLLAVGLLLTFTIGLSMTISSLNVRYRDINFFVQSLLIIWFYATPVIYSLSMIPSSLHWIWYFNPLTAVVQLFQHVFVNASMPTLTTLYINGISAIITALLGSIIFQKQSDNFDDFL